MHLCGRPKTCGKLDLMAPASTSFLTWSIAHIGRWRGIYAADRWMRYCFESAQSFTPKSKICVLMYVCMLFVMCPKEAAPNTSRLQSGRERSYFKGPIYSSQPITPRKALADDTGYIVSLPKEVQRVRLFLLSVFGSYLFQPKCRNRRRSQKKGLFSRLYSGLVNYLGEHLWPAIGSTFRMKSSCQWYVLTTTTNPVEEIFQNYWFGEANPVRCVSLDAVRRILPENWTKAQVESYILLDWPSRWPCVAKVLRSWLQDVYVRGHKDAWSCQRLAARLLPRKPSRNWKPRLDQGI